MWCFYRNLIPRWKLNSKSKVQKKFSLHKTIIGKKFSKPARTKNSRFKNFSICRKKLLFKIRIFFPKIPFQTLIFNEKACFKIMPFKRSTKCGKFVVFCGVNWIRTFFFRCEFLIEIWFLNKNWTQKLCFWKIFLLQNMIIRNVLYSKSAGTKNSQFKTWPFGKFSFQFFIVPENVCFRIWFFLFHKFHFKLWFSMKKFATKSCRLKSAGKVRNLFIVLGANRVKTLFLKCDVLIEIWFLNKNWTQNLIFRY